MSRVVIYYSPSCADCHSAMQYFDQHGVEYEGKNIEDPSVRRELIEEHDRMATPTIIIDGEKFLGFQQNKSEIKDALGL